MTVEFKVDMSNVFNVLSRQAVMHECATFFPELLPGSYGAMDDIHVLGYAILGCGTLCMGNISSQSGIQQGYPLGHLGPP